MIDRSLNYGRQHIKRFLKSVKQANLIVDLGAGQGDDLQIARIAHPNARLIGVENWQPNIELLSDRGVETIQLDLERDRLPFSDESVDIFIANQVLEHFKEVFWIFSEATRCLKKNGSFIIGVPNLAAAHNRILLMFGSQPSQIKTASAHVRGYTRKDINHFINSCFPGGYKIEAFGGSNFYPFPGAIARPLAAAFPNLAWGIFLHLRKQRPYSDEFLLYPIEHKLETSFWLGERTN